MSDDTPQPGLDRPLTRRERRELESREAAARAAAAQRAAEASADDAATRRIPVRIPAQPATAVAAPAAIAPSAAVEAMPATRAMPVQALAAADHEASSAAGFDPHDPNPGTHPTARADRHVLAFFDDHLHGHREHGGAAAREQTTGTAARSAATATGARRPGRRTIITALIAVGAILLAGLVGYGLLGDRIDRFLGRDDYSGEGNGTAVPFAVVEGDTGEEIASRLVDAGVVKTGSAFLRAAYGRAEEPVFIPGTFELQQEMSAQSALETLLDPANLLVGTVTIPEGNTAEDVYTSLSDSFDIPIEEFHALDADPASFGLPAEATGLEGFLFPATYDFAPGTDARTMLETMVSRTTAALDAAGVPEDQRWDVIRLASLIQKEAGLATDYPKVSRVFLNRVAEGMNLQSDATVAYGTGNTHRVTTTDSERQDASNPFNTYVHSGMVAGPISNPGDIAIDAAMHPADGTWLFFVTVDLDSGETVFSTTYDEHLQAVAKWQAWMDEHPEYQ